jgi:hypothetical protein
MLRLGEGGAFFYALIFFWSRFLAANCDNQDLSPRQTSELPVTFAVRYRLSVMAAAFDGWQCRTRC